MIVIIAADATPATRAALASAQGPVAATVSRVRRALLRAGVDCLDPTDLFSEDDLADRRDRLIAVRRAYDGWLTGACPSASTLSDWERGVLRLRALRLAVARLQAADLAARLGAAEIRLMRGGVAAEADPEALLGEDFGRAPAAAPRSARPPAAPWAALSLLPAGAMLDLRSRIAAGRSEAGAPVVGLRGERADALAPLLNLARVLAARLGLSRGPLRLVPPPAPVWPALDGAAAEWPDPPADLIGDPVLAAALGRATRATILDFRRLKASCDVFARRHGARLGSVRLNAVTTPAEAAMLAAMTEAGVTVVQESHGNVVVHGAGSRRALAAALAGDGYTSFPGSRLIAPRSPLQAAGLPPGPRLAPSVRVAAPEAVPAAPAEGRPFRILAAPNFLPWPQAFPGFVPSCFECQKTMEALARAVAGDPAFELRIRIKTTVADVADERMMGVSRGVVPEDMADVTALSDNIRDASLGSHREGLLWADLVVTEGMTNVLYEALELRRPVLLLNLSSRRAPTVEAARPLGPGATSPQGPIYAAGCDEDLPAVLRAIRDRRMGQALTDADLEGLVWLDAGARASRDDRGGRGDKSARGV